MLNTQLLDCDTAVQQSLCRTVTGRRVASNEAVLCCGISTVGKLASVEIKLVCSLVTAEAWVTLTEDLPVSGVDFLQRNYLAGGRVRVQPPFSWALSRTWGVVSILIQ